MTGFELYWILRLDAIVNFCIILAGIQVIFCVVVGFIYMMEFADATSESEIKTVCKLKSMFIKGLIGAAIFSLIALFVPTTNQALMIYTIPKIATTETLSELEKTPDLAIKALNQKLEEIMKEKKND